MNDTPPHVLAAAKAAHRHRRHATAMINRDTRPYRCFFCSRWFPSARWLAWHERRAHW